MCNYALFRQALGEDAWQRLAPAVRRHYDINPALGESQTLHGVMDIFHAPVIKPLLWLAQHFKALVPCLGHDVPVEVRNWTDPAHPNILFWHRTFSFNDGKTTVFASHMEAGENGEIIEFLRFGIGVRMVVNEQNGALVFTAREHCWKLGPWLIGIPNWALLGDALIVESAASADEIHLDFAITHPWLGRTFGYRGRFVL